MAAKRAARRTAFTLIELLVVISIIALLISILLPALRKARAAGRIAACLSNVRQLAAAGAGYAVDQKGAFPFHYPRQIEIPLSTQGYNFTEFAEDVEHASMGATLKPGPDGQNIWYGGWAYYMYKYIRTQPAFICPAQLDDPRMQAVSNLNVRNSYRANGIVTRFGLDFFKRPSTVVSVCDSQSTTWLSTIGCRSNYSEVGKSWETDAVWSGWMRLGSGSNIALVPHDKGRNYGFGDGHGEYIPGSEITSLKFGLLIQGEDKPEAGPDTGNSYTNPGRLGAIFN
ncbi:MAG: prepilin-type N-terminal cleavage/methylation domain-containing protein [Phycisphaeraceae bacterium]|nr:prepilin-type N-terminal cleavage/methylation domain-containing protein [Phycisphaeraceae bacterium]